MIISFVNFHQDSLAKDRWIGAYSIGLTFLGKLNCPRKKKKKKLNDTVLLAVELCIFILLSVIYIIVEQVA